MITKTVNITSGDLKKGLLALAVPLFVSSILQNVQSLIDLFWVGKLGSSSVAALALSGTVLMMLFPAILGLATGTVSVVSRYVGAEKYVEASRAGAQSIIMALLVGVITGYVGWMYSEPLCRLLGAGDDVARLGAAYLKISFMGSFTVFVLFVGNSVLQASGNTVVPMCAMVLANILNMLLDPLFIFGHLGFSAMGVKGAALATVLSQVIAAIIVLTVLSIGSRDIHITGSRWRLQPALAWRIVRLGIPSSGQMLLRSVMNLFLMRIVAYYGTAVIAAYGIGLRLQMIILMPAFALGNSAATFVGQNLGAHKEDRAYLAAWLAAGIDIAIMLFSGVILMVFAPSIIGVFDNDPQVALLGAEFLRIVSPAYIFVALAIVFGRAMQGAGDTVSPFISTLVALWGLQVPLAVVLSKHYQMEYRGVWWAMAAAFVLHGAMNTAWFETGKWKKKKI